MLPLLLHIRAGKNGKRPFGFYFPVFLIWIIVAALLLVALPFVLLAAAITWKRGPGRFLLLLYPLTASLLGHLSGLRIDVGSVENEILIDFL